MKDAGKAVLATVGSLTVEQFNQYAGALSLALTCVYTGRLVWLSFRKKRR